VTTFPSGFPKATLSVVGAPPAGVTIRNGTGTSAGTAIITVGASVKTSFTLLIAASAGTQAKSYQLFTFTIT
jgi:hypothetical protein